MASSLGANLTLMNVVPVLAPNPQLNIDADWRADVMRRVREELANLQNTVGSQAAVQVEGGDPARVLCDTAAEMKADLLVIGRGSTAGVFGRMRTNAYAIIRGSPCPVVSV
jgi:nucleotide-binding universal stress UspA family protein